jgi:drug/metabolite transporter (DMT)-like permease
MSRPEASIHERGAPGLGKGPGRPALVALVAAFGAIYLIWGSTYLAIRFAIETLPPFTMAGLRLVVAGSVLYIWGRLRGGERPRAIHWAAGILMGGVLFLVPHGGLTWAEQRVPSGVAALLAATIPFWMTILQAIRRGTGAIGNRTAAGIAGGFLGLLFLVIPREAEGGGSVDPVGAAVILLGAFSWAVGSSWSKTIPRPASPTLTTGVYLLTGGGLLLLLALATGEAGRLDLQSVSTRSLLALGYLSLLGSVVAFSAYTWLLQHVTLSAIGTYAYINPLVAVFLGWSLGGETLDARLMIVTGIVVGSVALALSGQAALRARKSRPARPACRGTDQPILRAEET